VPAPFSHAPPPSGFVIILHLIAFHCLQDGGFYSAEDADSFPEAGFAHKKEGAFCVWTKREISSLLIASISPEGKQQTMGDLFCYHYGVKEDGNVKPYQVSFHYMYSGFLGISFEFFMTACVTALDHIIG